MSRRVVYFSQLKALACVAVVLLHTFYAAAAFASDNSQKALMLSVRNAMMFAVPCFVMVTGALLLDPARVLTYKKLFGKLILRMVTALLVFSLLFSLFDVTLVAKEFTAKGLWDGFKTAFFGGGWKHMWYLYLMIALYLLMPAYRLVTKSASRTDILYLTGVYCVFLAILPTVESLTGKTFAFYICAFSVYPLYLFLGYAMHNELLRIPTPLAAILALAGLGLTVGLTVHYTGKDSEVNSLLGNYSFAVTVLTAAGIFGLLRAGKDRSHRVLDTLCRELEQCSFGIYLIHMAALKLVFAVWKLDPFAHGGALTVLGISAAVLIVSYGAVRLLRSIPGVRSIL